jgi:tRNA 5-methylaminomethyl-2-thiouridine biosynthesis bifunctional protein
MGRPVPIVAPSDSVLVIGGGLAGAGIAHSLSLRGLSALVVDPVFAHGLGASHAGHRAAALTPLLSRDDDIRARLSRAGTLRALQRWQPLPQPARPLRCGTLELAASGQDALDRQKTIASLSFPTDWAAWLDREQASERAGFDVKYGGVFFADGQLVQPEALIEALLAQPGVRCIAARVGSLERSQGQWVARDAFGAEVARAPTVVLANAAQARDLLSATPYLKGLSAIAGMQSLAGQVSYFDAAASGFDSRFILAGDGYWLPAVNYVSVGGSTYVPDTTGCAVTQQGHQAVIGKVAALLNVPAVQAEKWHAGLNGWAGWRAVAAGRLPVVGQVASAPGLWLACAYGSRGLTWSALAADLICAQLSHEPLMLERGLLRSIAPR